jgi:HKD family nuclease
MKKNINILIIIFLTCSNLFCYESNITPIDDRTYFETTHKILQSAKSSITMVMYYISLRDTIGKSQVLQLVNDLVDAYNRGVKVKVILDRTIDFRNESKEIVDDGEADSKNKAAYEYLKNNGVEVYYDTNQVYTHAKCIIVDDKIVILGSTNWSMSAFTSNNEVSVILESEEYAKQVLKKIDNIKVDQDVNNISDKDYLKFNLDMMKFFLKFIRRKDEFSYKLYFYILLYTTKTGEIRKPGNEQVELDYDKCVEYLGLTKLVKAKQRCYIRRFLTRLEKNYDCLITYLNPNDFINNPRIILQDKPFVVSPSPSHPEPRFQRDKLREGSFLYIPKKFFQYDWHKRLDIREQYYYFVNLIEGGIDHKSWSKSRKTLIKEYGLKKELITQSMLKLRYWNLLKVKYGSVENGQYSYKFPNVYKLQELYSMEDFNKNLQELINKYGKEKMDRIREYADIVYCGYDLNEMQNIILLEDTYGLEKVKKAFGIVASSKSKDTSKKGMGYIIGILKKEADKK